MIGAYTLWNCTGIVRMRKFHISQTVVGRCEGRPATSTDLTELRADSRGQETQHECSKGQRIYDTLTAVHADASDAVTMRPDVN